MINCSNCGAGIADDQEFCTQCGAPRPAVNESSSGEQSQDIPEVNIEVPEAEERETVLEDLPSEPEPVPYTAPDTYQAPQVPAQRSNTCLWVVLGCLFIALILVCVVVIALVISLAAFGDGINQFFQTLVPGLVLI